MPGFCCFVVKEAFHCDKEALRYDKEAFHCDKEVLQ